MAFFTSALVTTLLTSPPIEPPHTPSGPDPLDSDRDGVSDVKERAELLCTMDDLSLVPGEPLRLGDALAALPFRFRRDFVLKHGRELAGARGHAFERIADFVPAGLASQIQSATPTRPRVIMWDERTGLSIAFNAGADARRTGVELVTSSETDLSRAHLMRALGWRVRDLDIRFTYSTPRYDAFDSPTAPGDPIAAHPMDLGLLPYDRRDFNLDSLTDSYFNSYGDGSATFDELLGAIA